VENVNRVRTEAHLPEGARRAPTGIADRLRARVGIAVGVLVAAVAALVPATAASAAGTRTSGLYSGPEGSIRYELFVPSTYTPASPVPLVVALPGCTQTGDQFRRLTRWDAQAQAKGFIVVFPQQSASNNPLSCWNFFQDSSMHRGSGDPARIAAVTALIENTYNVDPNRVFVAGLSAGGAMASIMAAAYPDYYAAIGVGSGCEYAATATCAGYQSADPTGAGRLAYQEMGPRARPIPFIAFQGSADTTVPPKNAEQLVQQWLLTDDLADDGAANGSVPNTAAKTSHGFTRTAPGSGGLGRFYTVSTYNDRHKSQIGSYWLINGMKHAWSGGAASEQFSDPAGPDETAAMYSFFASHPASSLRRPPRPAGRRSGKPSARSQRAKPRVPRVSKLRISHGRIVFRISGAGSAKVRLQRRLSGHRKNGRCVAGARARRGCTRYLTKASVVRRAAKARRIAVRMPKRAHGHRLARGRYRVVVTPRDPAGHRGRSRTLAVVLR
jgi:poly(hydroxyalkanoate) depolymerase family esterase